MMDLEEMEAAQADMMSAIQRYVNARGEEPSGLIFQAVVIWEESGYDDNGENIRAVNYCCPAETLSLAAAVGLCELGQAYMKRDLIRWRVQDG